MDNLGKKTLLDLAVLLTEGILPYVAIKTTSSIIDKFERKISGKGAVREGKGFSLFSSNEDMDDIIKDTIRPLQLFAEKRKFFNQNNQ